MKDSPSNAADVLEKGTQSLVQQWDALSENESGECQYKAGCHRPAARVIDAPAIRDRFPNGVPACEPCADFYADNG